MLQCGHRRELSTTAEARKEPTLTSGGQPSDTVPDEVDSPETTVPSGRRASHVSRNLTQGSIPGNLLFLAWPQVLEGLFTVADHLADLFWAGRLGYLILAGVGVAQHFTALALTGRQGMDTAMRAMIARAVGAGDPRLASYIAVQAFALSLVLFGVLTIAGIVSTEAMLRLLGVSEAVIGEASVYMQVKFVAMAMAGVRLMSGASLQAAGDAITPMRASIVERIFHVVVSPFLIFGWSGFPEMGIAGAAAAQVGANMLAAFINLFVLFRGTSRLHLTVRGYRTDFPLLWRLVRIGAPASVTGLERSISQLVLVRLVTPFGDYALAAYGLTRRLEMLANMGANGVGMATGVIAAQNLGAGEPQRAKATAIWGLGYVALFKALMAMLFFSLGSHLLGLFSGEPELVDLAVMWLQIQVVGYVFMGVRQVLIQTIQVSGDTVPVMLTTLAGMWLIELPLALVLPGLMGLGQFGIAWATVISLIFGAVVLQAYLLTGRWTRVKVIEA